MLKWQPGGCSAWNLKAESYLGDVQACTLSLPATPKAKMQTAEGHHIITGKDTAGLWSFRQVQLPCAC